MEDWMPRALAATARSKPVEEGEAIAPDEAPAAAAGDANDVANPLQQSQQ